MVVERKLRCRQPLSPIVLEVVNICLEIDFNLLINLLSLPISLRVESSTRVRFHSNHGIELLHEPGYKLGTPITHNLVRDPMFMEHPVSENPCCAKSSQVHPNPLNQCLLGELVNDDQNGIVST